MTRLSIILQLILFGASFLFCFGGSSLSANPTQPGDRVLARWLILFSLVFMSLVFFL